MIYDLHDEDPSLRSSITVDGVVIIFVDVTGRRRDVLKRTIGSISEDAWNEVFVMTANSTVTRNTGRENLG